jgi:hypothetical protein
VRCCEGEEEGEEKEEEEEEERRGDAVVGGHACAVDRWEKHGVYE